MSWRAKSSSYRENAASARCGEMRKTCKGRSVGLTWRHNFLFQSQEPLGEWHVACLRFDRRVRDTAEAQKFRQYTEKVGYVLFIASNLLKTMVCQKISKNVKYYFYIRQNWRGMVLRKYTLGVHQHECISFWKTCCTLATTREGTRQRPKTRANNKEYNKAIRYKVYFV